jgi:hypothetical protein
MRNPWGREYYDGPFNDNDTANWDQDLQDQVNFVNENDGTFFIPFETYLEEFEYTQTHLDTEDLFQVYHLVLDDQSSNNFGSYIKHSFTVTSSVNQKIHVSANVWPTRSYPADCSPETNGHMADFGWQTSFWRFTDDIE